MISAKHANQHHGAQRSKGAPYRAALSLGRKAGIAVCLAVFFTLLILVKTDMVQPFDTVGKLIFVEALRHEWLTPIMQDASNLASPLVMIVMLIPFAAFIPSKKAGRIVLCNLAGIFLSNQCLKFLIHRARPEGFRLAEATGFSFPSGHAMVSTAYYGLLIWLIWQLVPNKRWRMIWACLLGAAIVLIEVSRIYLGVHYLSDICAGTALAIAWLAVFTWYIKPYVKS